MANIQVSIRLSVCCYNVTLLFQISMVCTFLFWINSAPAEALVSGIRLWVPYWESQSSNKQMHCYSWCYKSKFSSACTQNISLFTVTYKSLSHIFLLIASSHLPRCGEFCWWCRMYRSILLPRGYTGFFSLCCTKAPYRCSPVAFDFEYQQNGYE